MRAAFWELQKNVPDWESTKHTGRKTSRAFGNAEGMLQNMPPPASSEPSYSSAGPTFAGILATLSAPGQKRPPARDLDGFEDDVATLSYERALRVHSRFRTPDPTDRALTQPSDAIQPPFDDLPADATAPAIAKPPATAGNSQLEAELEARRENTAGPDRHLKSASVTVRLSKAEYAQLRMRAAEAGLTVSAYLRSCTLEAEALRAQVKEMLAQFRTETLIEMKPRESYADAASQKSSWLGRLRFWPHHGERPPAIES